MEKLQRQRALIQEQLRWIESEIAEEASRVPTGETMAAEPVRSPPPSPPIADLPTEAPPSPAPAAVEVPEPNVRGIHNEVRSGCLLYFGIALAVVALAVGYIYWRY